MAGILNKQFNADILEANNILLNGVNIDNYSILSESSSNTITDISGDYKLIITPDMLDSNGNYTYISNNNIKGISTKLTNFYKKNITINNTQCKFKKVIKTDIKKFVPKYIGNPIYMKKDLTGTYFKQGTGFDTYKIDNELNKIIDNTIILTNDNTVHYKYCDTNNSYIRIPLSQFQSLGTNFKMKIRLAKLNNSSSTCWFHLSRNNDNTYSYWGNQIFGDTSLHTLDITNTKTTLDDNPFTHLGIDLGYVNKDFIIGADRDGDSTFNDFGRVLISYIKIYDLNNNLKVFYDFTNNELGDYYINKGSNGGSASIPNNMISYEDGIYNDFISDMYYEYMGITSNIININIEDKLFESLELDLYI